MEVLNYCDNFFINGHLTNFKATKDLVSVNEGW